MHCLHRPFLLGCFASAAIAQTYIVDAANGPGTHFTQIAAAVAAVPDGAVLDVRAGNYASFTIASKGLSVLCASGVIVTALPAVTVTGTSTQQTVELRGMNFWSGNLVLAACQGRILLYGCTLSAFPFPGALRANACPHLHADNCNFGIPGSGLAVFLDGCVAVFRNCTAGAAIPTTMDLRSSFVQLVDCAVSSSSVTPASLVMNAGGDLRVVGGSLLTSFSSYCIGGSGSARVDPGVAVNNNLFSPTVQGSVLAMPSVGTVGGTLGSLVISTMRGPIADLGALLVGLPGPPLLFPGFADAFWLQPGTEAVCAFTVFAAGVPLSVTYPVPNVPAMRGMRFCWQGVSYGATNGLQASNPAITTHW